MRVATASILTDQLGSANTADEPCRALVGFKRRKKLTGGFSSLVGRNSKRLAHGVRAASTQDTRAEGVFVKTTKSAVHRAVLQALACASGLALAAPHAASADQAKVDVAVQPQPKALKTAHKTIAAGKSRGAAAPVRVANAAADGPASPAAPASDAQTEQLAEVIVVGQKEAISNALRLKKEAPTIVDSVTATDIGAFPDKSASESLERLPGITVSRLQSDDDSTHPSGEPTGVLIRGLPMVRTEFNGRDAFTADSGRGLQFNDVSPDLLSRIDAYKNQTADMIEGGLAGTVDLVTRLPFDQRGPVLVGSVEGDYDDRGGKTEPAYSVLASDSWNTDAGRFGLLGDYSASHVITRTESVIDDKIDTYCSSGYGTAAHAIVNADGSVPCTGNVFGGKGWAFAPDGIRYSQVDYDRDRIGSTIATQYENNSKSVLATVQYTDSSYHNAWLEDASHAILDGTYYGTPGFDPRASSILAGSSGLVFGSNGMLQSGLLTQGHGSWSGSYSPNLQDAINTGSAVPGVPFVNDCGPGFTCTTNRDGLYFQNETRDFNHMEDTKEASAHVKWDITSQLHTNFDAQYVKSSVVNHDMLVATGSMANYQYSTGSNGIPQVQLLPGSNVNYAPGDLSNPHNYWIPFIQGHEEDDGGKESAFAADMKYDLNAGGGWLDSLKAGVRYADRDQTTRYSTFNWTPIAANWNCNGPGFNITQTTPAPYPVSTAGCNARPQFNGYGAGIWGTTNFNSFYNSGVYPNGNLVFMNRSTITNTQAVLQALSGAVTNSPIAPGYQSICDRTGNSLGSCFLPSEVEQLSEQTKAGYAMLNFGGKDAELFGVDR